MEQKDLFVCIHCFEDPGLVDFVQENAVANECSFCANKGSAAIAAPIGEVAEYFIKCLFREYDLSVNRLGWISSEGGWIGASWDAYDLALDVVELEFPQDNQFELLPHLFGDYYIDQDWCEANGYGPNDQEWARYSWEKFCRVVMHERRFFFLHAEEDPYELGVGNPGEVLQTIFEYAQHMDLFKDLPSGALLWRARWEACNSQRETPEDLGPPPVEKANQSNRMSPSGIPMFYACDDQKTALKETASGPGYFALGQFETLRPAILLDLTDIPPLPTLFESVSDSLEVVPRKALLFLHHVASEVSRPIERGKRIHVDYVPTQVVTEFIRDQLTWEESRVDGIKYSSSVRPGHVSYVLFANQGNILSTPDSSRSEDQWLRLTDVEHRWSDFDLTPKTVAVESPPVR